MENTLFEYKRSLLEADFKEATKNPNHFYRKETAKTVFIVNLKPLENGIGIVYGFCSTAFLWDKRNEVFFVENGISDSDCQLRFYAKIDINEPDDEVKKVIDACFRAYALTEKDELLRIVNDRRKKFFAGLTTFLKPYGFRKKGNLWRKPLSPDINLGLLLDKNPYTDLYYFEVNVSGASWYHGRRMMQVRGGDVFDYVAQPNAQFDWQLQTEDELIAVLEMICARVLLPLMQAIPQDLDGAPSFYVKMLDALCLEDGT